VFGGVFVVWGLVVVGCVRVIGWWGWVLWVGFWGVGFWGGGWGGVGLLKNGVLFCSLPDATLARDLRNRKDI